MMVKKAQVFGKGNFINRRRFVRAGALCALGGALSYPRVLRGAELNRKLRLRVVYVLHSEVQNKPDWPYLGFDFRPVMKSIKNLLINTFPEIDFCFSTASGPSQAHKIVLQDLFSRVDGYIVYQMNNWNLVVQTLAGTGKPVLFVDYQYGGTGGVLVYSALFLRFKARNVGFVASSSFEDLIAGVKCFEIIKKGGTIADFVKATVQTRKERTPAPGNLTCLPDSLPSVSIQDALEQMRSSKILAIGYPGVSFFTLPFIPVRFVSYAELNQAYTSAELEQAQKLAEHWQKTARAVEGVSFESLKDSARMYLGMKALLRKYQANAITINCLVGFYNNLIKAYPCLGFYQLCNEGLIGACECDVRSAGTMIAVNCLTKGRPGYISDPVLDSSQRHIIYAHCVAPSKPFGPEGPENPFEILTHSEDRKGASVRSILPSGYLTTTLEIAPEKRQILFHQAKTVGNDPEERACRTKLVAEPIGDFEKLFTKWDQWGWHRVTVYGDLKETLQSLAEAIDYRLVPEA